MKTRKILFGIMTLLIAIVITQKWNAYQIVNKQNQLTTNLEKVASEKQIQKPLPNLAQERLPAILLESESESERESNPKIPKKEIAGPILPPQPAA